MEVMKVEKARAAVREQGELTISALKFLWATAMLVLLFLIAVAVGAV